MVSLYSLFIKSDLLVIISNGQIENIKMNFSILVKNWYRFLK